MLAKIAIIIVGIIGAFFLSGLLTNFIPLGLPSAVYLATRLVVLIVSTIIIMQIAGRIERQIDRKP
jgi:uncharacterized membrane protein YeaQ/YmgE (transglycosylase-associated protein family)